MVVFDGLFFERILNGFILLLSFLLFIMVLNVSDMDKRQYCYNYIQSAQCYCIGADINQLLNDSVAITGIIEFNSTEKLFEDSLSQKLKK